MWQCNSAKNNFLSLRVAVYRHSLRKYLRKLCKEDLNQLYVDLATKPSSFKFTEYFMRQVAIQETLKEFNSRD